MTYSAAKNRFRLSVLWITGCVLVFCWVLFGDNTPLLVRLQQDFHNTGWIEQTGDRWYRALLVTTGTEQLLLAQTSAKGQMGNAITRILMFFHSATRTVLGLVHLFLYRMALLVASLPWWGVVLVAATLDGLLVRRGRYHDFRYTSPVRNLWSRRAAQWIPVLLCLTALMPLRLPLWWFPLLAGLSSFSFGYWVTSWQKQI